MSKFNLFEIQEKIGYNFSNTTLLHQAFISPSVSVATNNQKENYQVLEFIGDAVLGLAVVKNMASDYCIIEEDGQLKSKKTLGTLSTIKQEQVKNMTLDHCAKMLTLNKFEEKNNSFAKQDVRNKKGDLIEAIIGAVAIDCNWNIEIICSVVKKLLSYSNIEENYSIKLESFCKERNAYPVKYSFTETKDLSNVECFVSIPNASKVFSAKSFDRLSAKNIACKQALSFLIQEEKLILEEQKNSISVLNEFCQKKHLSHPVYNFKRSIKKGKVSWDCDVSIEECELFFSAKDSIKRQAKATAAKALLLHLKGKDKEIQIDFCVDTEKVIRGMGLLKLIESKYL